MIFITSRYASSSIKSLVFKSTNKTTISVFRTPPKNLNNLKVKYYRWVEGDRIDRVAEALFGNPELWWKIMDVNPEIYDPHSIEAGDIIRIPQ